jgi:propionate CoA-transferase
LQKLAFENEIEAYNLPQGVVSQLYRDIAGHRPRTITKVGLGTFVDPRQTGGKINERTTEDIVEVMVFDGREYLAYRTFPIHVAILRGTTADTRGNITMEKEALTLDSLAMATAARNSGGFVIVQVERVAEYGTLSARQIKIPGILVDCVVVSKPENHWQTFGDSYNPARSAEIKMPLRFIPPMSMGDRKIIARRAVLELRPNHIVNLGIGMPEGVSVVANEEKILNFLTLTAEPGVIGGLPEGGLNFGSAINTDALIDQSAQFDFYDGGGLDISFLGLAEADRHGNLNVSKFGPRLAGAGGFINISQNAQKVAFVGTFTTGGLQVDARDGRLTILREGTSKKFVHQVEHITFSGPHAVRKNQPVLYITERCVFQLTEGGMELMEIAPGIDLKRDILDQMEFVPLMKEPLKRMDERIFQTAPMGLADTFFNLPLEERFSYDPGSNLFYINFEGYTIKTHQDIQQIREAMDRILAPLGRRVDAIVNYDHFEIGSDLLEDYTDLVKTMGDAYYESVTRYTASTFLRLKLGEALKDERSVSRIYETMEKARRILKKSNKPRKRSSNIQNGRTSRGRKAS